MTALYLISGCAKPSSLTGENVDYTDASEYMPPKYLTAFAKPLLDEL